jgi:VanZ family protein
MTASLHRTPPEGAARPDAPAGAGPARSRRLWLWAPVVLYMTAIFLVSSLPAAPLPPDVSDKTAHTAAYAGLAILATRAVAGGLPARIGWRTAAMSLAITTGYGVSDEVHQLFVPGRTADPGDVAADALGAVIGVGLCWAWGIIVHRCSKPCPRSL